MKPTYDTLTVESTLPVKGRRMTIDPNSMAYILKILIDLYSDKELAVLRELSTNAIDSHIMAGNSDPIEVFLPSALSPYLMIKDRGLGLAVEEIYDLFGQYGASTKRETNDATGMLGLGSKSPLTYTDQFTMTAIKDGVRAIVAITRSEDGVGQLTVVDTATTNEPNGVEIKIPAKLGHSFVDKANNFFKYWKPGTVLLNGKDPSVISTFMEVTPTIFLRKAEKYETDQSIVVMGNVPYPVPELTSRRLGFDSYSGHRMVAYVPIGTVDFVPSREALQDTKRTRETIASVEVDFKKGLDRAVQRKIHQAKTHQDALQAVMDWGSLYTRRSGGMPEFKYLGATIPTEIHIDRHTDQRMVTAAIYNPAFRSRNVSSPMDSVQMRYFSTSVFITGFDQKEATLTLRKKLLQWMQKNSVVSVTNSVWLNFHPEALRYIDQARIVSIDTIRAEKLPKSVVTTSGRIPGSFDVLIGDRGSARTEFGVAGDKLDQSNPIFYLRGNRSDAVDIADALDIAHKQYTVIYLGYNRLAKFQRENPTIVNARDEVKRVTQEAIKKVTEKEKQALAQSDNYSVRSTFSSMRNIRDQIDDPAIKQAIDLSQVSISHLATLERTLHTTIPRDKWMNPLSNYPLCTSQQILRSPGAVVRYLNFEYAYQQEQKKP